MKKYILFLIFMLTVSILNSFGQKKEIQVEAVWEKMIEAKGGRTALLAIENVYNSHEDSFNVGLKKYNSRYESLIIPPNKMWIWDDNRPSSFGLRMSMWNFDTQKQYFVQFEDSTKNWEVKTIKEDGRYLQGMVNLVYLLPESKYWKPKPEKLSEGRKGFKKTTVIQTRMTEYDYKFSITRIDFELDSKTFLPLKLSYFVKNLNDNGEHVSYEIYLSEYIKQNGIKVPTVVDNIKQTYQFNVEYNEDIFKTPPLPVETAFEAWKVKK